MISQDRLKEILEYDRYTGIFIWINVPKQHKEKLGLEAGYLDKSTGYIKIGISGKQYKAHRLAILYTYGNLPIEHVDHIDGVRCNNILSNLRCVSRLENNQNQRVAHKNNLNGFLGVSFHSITKKYQARIGVNGISKNIGLFSTPEEANKAYLSAKRKLHLTCTI
jgi:hypothetical protein